MAMLKQQTSTTSEGGCLRIVSSIISRCCAVLLWTLIVVWFFGIGCFIWIAQEQPKIDIQGSEAGVAAIANNNLKSLEQQHLPLSSLQQDDKHGQGVSSFFLRRWPSPLVVRVQPQQQQVTNQAAAADVAVDLKEENESIKFYSHFYDNLVFHIRFYGDITVQLRPDLSPGSVKYLHELVEQGCARCYFHRKISLTTSGGNDGNNKKSKYNGFLLGTMSNHNIPLNSAPGKCPSEFRGKDPKCSVWNTNTEYCQCNGPRLETGMVGWVEGTFGGPEFFIFNSDSDDDSSNNIDLGTKYTIFGQLVSSDDDEINYEILLDIMDLDTDDVDNKAAITNTDDHIPGHHSVVYKDKIEFTLSLQ